MKTAEYFLADIRSGHVQHNGRTRMSESMTNVHLSRVVANAIASLFFRNMVADGHVSNRGAHHVAMSSLLMSISKTRSFSRPWESKSQQKKRRMARSMGRPVNH